MIVTLILDDKNKEYSTDGKIGSIADKVVSVSATHEYVEYIIEDVEGNRTHYKTSFPWSWITISCDADEFEKLKQEREKVSAESKDE